MHKNSYYHFLFFNKCQKQVRIFSNKKKFKKKKDLLLYIFGVILFLQYNKCFRNFTIEKAKHKLLILTAIILIYAYIISLIYIILYYIINNNGQQIKKKIFHKKPNFLIKTYSDVSVNWYKTIIKCEHLKRSIFLFVEKINKEKRM